MLQLSTCPRPCRAICAVSGARLARPGGLLRGATAILDPFGGVGGVFQLRAWLGNVRIEALEMEPCWAAADPRITQGNALALPWGSGTFDAICTSPAYGNRMADHHEARDATRRNTYRHALEQPTARQRGALQWGAGYRDFHTRAWTEAAVASQAAGSC